ncbi:MAG: sigma-70 family RNA polymerase sigma factor [Thermoguttaceae bacterium]|nr:sigma-70 family RNA polymerase sigma factor [Thermoguttaceae bacterium]MDW8079803.1 sigma-70 family RNA polymerase sigma factor [Thermoguttaceae bacterium]
MIRRLGRDRSSTSQLGLGQEKAGRDAVREVMLVTAAGHLVPQAVTELMEQFLKPAAKAVFRANSSLAKSAGYTPEDLANFALEKVWRGYSSYKARGSLYSWLKTIIAHVLVDKKRKDNALGGKCVPRPDELPAAQPRFDDDPERVARYHELEARFCEIFAGLPPSDQIILKMKAEGFSQEVIAIALKANSGAISRRINQLRKQLEKDLNR